MKDGWEKVGLLELEEEGSIELGRGKVISKKDLAAMPGSFPVYSSAKENDGKFGEYGLYMFDEELITWSVDGGGRLFHRPRHKFSVTNVGGFIRVLDRSRIDYRFFYYALSHLHEQVTFDWVKKAHPSVIRKVYTEIPLPPLEEQQRIVAILDEAFEGLDRAKANAEANLASAKELFQEASSNVAADVRRSAVSNKPLSEIAAFRNGLNYSKSSTGECVRIVGVSDFADNFALEADSVATAQIDGNLKPEDTLARGDILAVRSNGNKALIGRTILVPQLDKLFSFSGFTIRIRITDAQFSPAFVCTLMKTKSVRDELTRGGGGANISNLNQGTLGRLSIPVLSEKKQAEFVERLAEMRALCAQAENDYRLKERQIEKLRQSLLTKAFAGELT